MPRIRAQDGPSTSVEKPKLFIIGSNSIFGPYFGVFVETPTFQTFFVRVFTSPMTTRTYIFDDFLRENKKSKIVYQHKLILLTKKLGSALFLFYFYHQKHTSIDTFGSFYCNIILLLIFQNQCRTFSRKKKNHFLQQDILLILKNFIQR